MPDKRFKSNYQIPVVEYGKLHFYNSAGLNEEYRISNYEASEAFGNAFLEYKSVCKFL